MQGTLYVQTFCWAGCTAISISFVTKSRGRSFEETIFHTNIMRRSRQASQKKKRKNRLLAPFCGLWLSLSHVTRVWDGWRLSAKSERKILRQREWALKREHHRRGNIIPLFQPCVKGPPPRPNDVFLPFSARVLMSSSCCACFLFF